MDEMDLAGCEEPKVVYDNMFDLFNTDLDNPKDSEVSYYSKDKQTMYTKSIAVPVIRTPPPRGSKKPPPPECKLYRYVFIREDFWVGVNDPGTRLLTDEELYDTLKLEHDPRWKHIGYRSEQEPHILLFQYANSPEEHPPTYKSEEERRAAIEEMTRKRAAIKEAERKCKEPYDWFVDRNKRMDKSLEDLTPISYPRDKIPFRECDEFGGLIIPYAENPLKTEDEELKDRYRRKRILEFYTKREKKYHQHQKKMDADPNYHEPFDYTVNFDDERQTPRQRNNHVKTWMAERMKRALNMENDTDETSQ